MSYLLRTLIVLVLTVTCLIASARAGEPERWKGEIKVPGQPLGFAVVITRSEHPAATMDIPVQGLKDGPLSDLKVEGRVLAFTLALPSMAPTAHAVFSVEVAEDGATAKGTMVQGGATFPVEMTRLKDGEDAGPKRPQNPKPPYPYSAEEVLVLGSDGAKLPGTLTIPGEKEFGKGPHPVVLLITGSGIQDRDESLLGHKPFLVVADHLTRHGVAVLRVDDRSWAGHFNPAGEDMTTRTFADDAKACVKFLQAKSGIDAKRIGLVGHSEGGIIAPMVASEMPDVAFIVLLAGTGVPLDEVLRAQKVALMKAAGADAATITRASGQQTKVLELIKFGAETAVIEQALREQVREEMGLGIAAQATAEQQRTIDQVVKQQVRAMNSAWMRYACTMDPRASLRRVRCPVLAINGSLDAQVVPSQNLPEIEKALKEGANTDYTIKELPGLNHLFQHCTTGSFTEYAQIEETFSPEALELVSDWIRKHTGLTK